jgi:hypothetical protein
MVFCRKGGVVSGLIRMSDFLFSRMDDRLSMSSQTKGPAKVGAPPFLGAGLGQPYLSIPDANVTAGNELFGCALECRLARSSSEVLTGITGRRSGVDRRAVAAAFTITSRTLSDFSCGSGSAIAADASTMDNTGSVALPGAPSILLPIICASVSHLAVVLRPHEADLAFLSVSLPWL